jgi:putative ABC transport system ATP-binding protein
MPAVLAAVGLGKSFPAGRGTVTALKSATFSIERGGFVAVEGPSGSGKSTLLSLLAGLDRPTAGEAWLDGERIDGLPESRVAAIRREKVGFVFQAFHLVPSLTVLENVCLPLAFKTGRFDAPRGEALLERVGLSDRAGHLPSKLSGGEKQRAALARALVNDPLLVFADEPTGNLDSASGARVMDLLLEHTQKAGRTLVLVTHDPALAARADRRIRLKDGEVQG